jgi:Ca-activated chloride channel family protein
VLGLLAAGFLPPPLGRLEAWLTNSRVSTRRALQHHRQGEEAEAIRRLEQGLRLHPGDPLAHYNLGTARLLSGHTEAAEPSLLAAAETATGSLAAAAWYNLGTARLETGQIPPAIEAFEEALRVMPDHRDAKINLEIALARLEPPSSPPGGNQRQPEEGAGDPGDEPTPTSPLAAPPGDSSLPAFRPPADLSREQAISLLEAITNLERDARRTLPEAVPSPARGGKDW